MSLNLEKFRNLFLDTLKNYNTDQVEEFYGSVASGDSVDLVTVEREKLLTLKLQGRDTFYLRKVRQALTRVEDGSFGVCEECGDDINEARLNARPTATMCVHCKEEQERSEDQVLYQKKSHTHGRGINSNVINLPIQNEEVLKEKILEFNKRKIDLGASACL